MKSRRWMFVSVFAALFQAAILFPSVSLATEPFEFVSAVLASFQRCKIADSRLEATHQAGDLLQDMKDIAILTSEIRIAKSLVEPHTRSQHELIRETAKGFVDIYSGIVANKEETLSLLEMAYNNIDIFAKQQGTVMRKFSENMAQNEQLWRALMDATVLSTYTLVDMNRAVDGKLSYLAITNAERNQLRATLRGIYGDKVTQGLKAGQISVDASGALLWEFLAKPYKAADTP